MSEESLLREVREMREQVIQTIDTVKRLLEIHITQVENLEQRLARLEEALTPKEENNG